MTISEIINSQEDLEPEFIRHVLPDLTEEDFNWLMACRTVKLTTHFLEDMYIFENIVRALNHLPVDFTNTQGTHPNHVFYALDLFRRLWKGIKLNFSWEVETYVKFVFSQYGYHSVNPLNEDRDDEIHQLANILLDPNNTDFAVDEHNPKHIAAQCLAEAILYTKQMKANEFSN